MADLVRYSSICVVLLYTVSSVIMLQHNYCEEDSGNGMIEYTACSAEPLHLLRNAIFKVDATPEDYTCGAQREAYCTLVSQISHICHIYSYKPTFVSMYKIIEVCTSFQAF